MKLDIDVSTCENAQDQIVKIFKILVENELLLEAKIYSIIFEQMNKHKVVDELTYENLCKVFIERKDSLPTKEDFEKALSQLKKVEVKYIDDKGLRRSTQLIKEVS